MVALFLQVEKSADVGDLLERMKTFENTQKEQEEKIARKFVQQDAKIEKQEAKIEKQEVKIEKQDEKIEKQEEEIRQQNEKIGLLQATVCANIV